MEYMIYGSQPKHILIFFPFSIITTRSLYEGWSGIYTPSFLNQASCPLPIILDFLFSCHQKEDICCFKKFGNYWSNKNLSFHGKVSVAHRGKVTCLKAHGARARPDSGLLNHPSHMLTCAIHCLSLALP